ncbi:sulfatase-like hydrolase/transferase [Natrarchaeobius oligotrophus]|nr:sulfatase-like hydrolase/transferase [Natrarchaeobius chitinivorans]
MITPSTGTLQSVSAITTGQYPSRHKLWRKDREQLAKRPELFESRPNYGLGADTSWVFLDSSEKPIVKVHRLNGETRVTDLKPPFVYVELDKGGHSPYGIPFEEQPDDETFWRGRSNEELKKLYERGVQKSTERFHELVDTLSAMGVLEETLVVFLGDHGELLGEVKYGGFYGHASPLVPEVVTVPVVFLGAGLPKNEQYEPIISGVDIAPTLLAAMGKSVPDYMDGDNLWDTAPEMDRIVRSETIQLGEGGVIDSIAPRPVPAYSAVSFWDRSGGYVFHQNNALVRFVMSQYWKLIGSPPASLTRKNWTPGNHKRMLEIHCRNQLTFGDPNFTPDDLSIPSLDY